MSDFPAVFSFFAGAGFLDLGFETTGYEIVHVNEIHQPFLEAYRYSRRQMGMATPIYGYDVGDVSQFLEGRMRERLGEMIVEQKAQEKPVGFIGGPPCPDFSVGGKNRGRKGDYGQLTATYVELICAHQPDFFLFENVKGLWRTQKHRVFYEEMKDKLKRAGYVVTEKLINALEYGVPQDRQRIILIGFSSHLVDGSYPKREIPVGVFPWHLGIRYDLSVLKTLPWPTTDEFVEDAPRQCPDGIVKSLTVEDWFIKNGVEEHVNAKDHFVPRAGLKRMKVIPEGDDSGKSFKRLHRWRYSPTAAYGNNEVHLHPYKVRRLSAAEALAIQSLPREFTLPRHMSLTDMFETIGNGVPFLASQGMATSILAFLGLFPIQSTQSEAVSAR